LAWQNGRRLFSFVRLALSRWMNFQENGPMRSMLACLRVTVMVGAALVSAQAQQTVQIHDIMKDLPASPLLGQNVSVSGVVVGVMSTGGFYMTALQTTWDTSSATAEGMPVFAAAGATPACAVVGNMVVVVGTVVNGTGLNGADTPATGVNPTSCTVVGDGSINSPITLTAATAFGSYLASTGMPISNTTFNAISPTAGATNTTTGAVTSTGQFWVDINTPTNGHLFKSAGLEADEFYPQSPPAPAKGSSPGIPAWAGNPQRLFVDTTTFGGAPIDIGAGQVLTCVAANVSTAVPIGGVGVIDFSLGYNRLLVFATTTCTVSGSIAPSITSPADSTHFHVGTINLNSFTGSSSPSYATRLAKAALAIVNVFGKPDILSVQEVQDLATLQAIGDAASQLAGTGVNYQAYFAPSNDSTLLGLGFLVNTNNVSVSKSYQVSVGTTFTKFDGTNELLWERPPFVLETGLLRNGENYQVEVIDVHTTERAGIDDPTNGVNIWQRRGAQAADLSALANAEQIRGQNILIAGEYNAYSFSDGFADIVDVVAGTGPPAQGTVAQYESTLTQTPMYNFVKSITVSNSTYNIIENGNARSIEHILCSETQNSSASGSIYSYISAVTQPHWTTDFPAVDANDPTQPAGLTGRDGFVGAFLIPPVPTTASLTPSTANFGNVFRGAASSATVFTVTNSSTFPSTVNVTNIAFTGADPGDFTQTSNCTSLNEGATCTVQVVFTPQAAGTRTATLQVTTDAQAVSVLTATLTGTGVDTTASLTPAAATFPATFLTATSAAQVFTFTNTGGYAETVAAASVTAGYIITANNCAGATIAAAGTCAVSVAFAPATTGNVAGTLTVTSSSTLNPTLTSALTGTGLATTATLTPATANFANTVVGHTSAAQNFVWTNTSGVALTIAGVAASGDFQVAGTTCSGSTMASCTVAVTFAPTIAESRTGMLTVTSSSSANGTLTSTLTGIGVSDLVLSQNTLDFGYVDIGRLVGVLNVGLTNYDAQAASLTSLAVSGDYSYTTTCGSTLASGATCYFQLSFQPTALGPRPGALTITTGDPRIPALVVSLTGNGVDFGITLAPTSGTLLAGYSAVVNETITPIDGYTNGIYNTCQIPSNEGGSLCVPLAGFQVSNVTTTYAVNITTTSQYTVIGYYGMGARNAWLAIFAFLSLAGLAFGRGRRSLRWVSLVVLLAVMGSAGMGCGDKIPARNADPTYPGTYTYTVTATDGFLSHSATYTLTVTAPH
jgi:hypothetical protein